MFATLAALFGVLTLGLLSPGPDFLLILRNSLGPSSARAFGTVAGICCGLAVQTLVIALGFAALPPAAMRALQLAGAAYLAYLGVRALFSLPPSSPASEEHEIMSRSGQNFVSSAIGLSPALRSGFIDGLVCNVTNPKAFLFFVGVFSQAIPSAANLVWRVAVPAAVVIHGVLLWSLVVFALRSPPVAGQLARAQHWLPRAFGVALLGLAAWLIRGALVP